MLRHDMVWNDTVPYGTVWDVTTRYGTVPAGTVGFSPSGAVLYVTAYAGTVGGRYSTAVRYKWYKGVLYGGKRFGKYVAGVFDFKAKLVV